MSVLERSVHFVVASIACMGLTACDKGGASAPNSNASGSIAEGIAASATSVRTANPSPPIPSTTADDTAADGSFAASIDRYFTQKVRLPGDGFAYEDIRAVSDHAVLILGRSLEADASKIVLADAKTGEVRELLTVRGTFDDFVLLPDSGENAQSLKAQWYEYSTEEDAWNTVRWIGGKQERFAGLVRASPDGNKLASYRGTRPGIWGIDAATGEREQWTTGPRDAQPLWLPDNSGFIYLKDTGATLGDGAGPAYELARFELRTGKSKALRFESGFWGGIDWMTPGRTILASNGFDDGVGLKAVDLQDGAERQFLSSTRNARHAYNSRSHQVLVSQEGQLSFFSEKGQPIRSVPWPDGLAGGLAVNPAWTQTGADDTVPYYAAAAEGGSVGATGFRFSPDGTKLLYQVGQIGQSIYDQVRGSILVLAAEDGTSQRALTNDFFRIQDLEWMPSSSAIAAIVAPAEGDGETYAGVMSIP